LARAVALGVSSIDKSAHAGSDKGIINAGNKNPTLTYDGFLPGAPHEEQGPNLGQRLLSRWACFVLARARANVGPKAARVV
jgi:hypothetical protein